EKAAAELGVPFLGRIPIDPGVVTKCDLGQPFVADSSDSEAKEAFTQITQRVLEAVQNAHSERIPRPAPGGIEGLASES
ncbi:MAG: P-loop NTPase, partial [Desulfatiglandales bacterium]